MSSQLGLCVLKCNTHTHAHTLTSESLCRGCLLTRGIHVLSPGRSSPSLDPLRKSPSLDQGVQTAPLAAPAPPVPVGQRSPARPSATATGSQKPGEALDQRRGTEHETQKCHTHLKCCHDCTFTFFFFVLFNGSMSELYFYAPLAFMLS